MIRSLLSLALALGLTFSPALAANPSKTKPSSEPPAWHEAIAPSGPHTIIQTAAKPVAKPATPKDHFFFFACFVQHIHTANKVSL